MVTLALEGPASYRDRHELVFRHRAERPNALWQVDHTELDILIKDPSGRPSRPWLTTVMDDYSRAIRVHGLRGRTLRDEHRAGAAPSHLA